MSAEIIDIDPCADQRWSDLHADHDGTLFTSPGWMAAVAHTYGFEPRAKLALTDGTATFGIVE